MVLHVHTPPVFVGGSTPWPHSSSAGRHGLLYKNKRVKVNPTKYLQYELCYTAPQRPNFVSCGVTASNPGAEEGEKSAWYPLFALALIYYIKPHGFMQMTSQNFPSVNNDVYTTKA